MIFYINRPPFKTVDWNLCSKSEVGSSEQNMNLINNLCQYNEHSLAISEYNDSDRTKEMSFVIVLHQMKADNWNPRWKKSIQ